MKQVIIKHILKKKNPLLTKLPQILNHGHQVDGHRKCKFNFFDFYIYLYES